MANSEANAQASVALSWLEHDPDGKDSICKLVSKVSISTALEKYLQSPVEGCVPLPRSLFPEELGLPMALSQPDPPFWRVWRVHEGKRVWLPIGLNTPPDLLFLHVEGGKRVRSAMGILMLNPAAPEEAWTVFINGLTSWQEHIASYAALMLGKFDPATGRRAAREMAQALYQWKGDVQDDDYDRPAICKGKEGDINAPSILVAVLERLGDQSTIDVFRPMTENEPLAGAAELASQVITAIERRLRQHQC
jgi:hypothetical protein